MSSHLQKKITFIFIKLLHINHGRFLPQACDCFLKEVNDRIKMCLINKAAASIFHKVKPYVAMVMLQLGFAGMYVISQAMLKKGMNHFAMVVYRNIIAFVIIAPFAHWFERSLYGRKCFNSCFRVGIQLKHVLCRARRPKMTSAIFFKILALVMIEYCSAPSLLF
ncbi:hypothetical protein HPP92_015786 [Vanilla planifolia]|uniref:WAT1-related protein n=1 Tax=Vanilla planifolia TaxID=51239 RepID=A0A835QAU5_VANPL|nr:hypothetical protein HPP92_016400 [Vanilla planifolia]KAG0471240.1 hypothetical protein HPP92_015786 [Vanilla planifolia]